VQPKLHSHIIQNEYPPLIILHGLYGSGDNWISIGKQLSQSFCVHLIDQRNHGQSPHLQSHTYNDMANDLLDYCLEKQLSKFTLIGHSMGGKTAMTFALQHPDMITNLAIIDIAPKAYTNHNNYARETTNHTFILESLKKIDFANASTRNDLDRQLKDWISDNTLRQFLLKSVGHTRAGYYWKLNLDDLLLNMSAIMDGFSNWEIAACQCPTLFIRGANSPYFLDNDIFTARKFFPKANFVTIQNAGHWVHAQQPDLVLKTLLYFFDES